MNFDRVKCSGNNTTIEYLRRDAQLRCIDFAVEHTIKLCELYNEQYRKIDGRDVYGPGNYYIPLTYIYIDGILKNTHPLHFLSKYSGQFTFRSFSPDGNEMYYSGIKYDGDFVPGADITDYYSATNALYHKAHMECFQQSFSVHDVNQLREVLPYVYQHVLDNLFVEIPTPANKEMFNITPWQHE